MKNIWTQSKSPILALAPMAGYTDSAFRLLCLKNGADIVYTEMISVEAIWRKNKKTLIMLKLLPQEKNVILQLFGSKPESFAKALEVIHSLPEASRRGLVGIDVNLGCPARKVYRTGAGAALMNNKKLAKKIIQTVLDNTKLPLSIKIRSKVKDVTAVEFINYIKDLPISAVMIHGRSLKQGFSGPVDYTSIKKIKELLTSPNPSFVRRGIKISVLANGRIYTPQDARIMLEKTNADGLGIARGSWGRPWVFKEIKQKLTSPNPFKLATGNFKLVRRGINISPLTKGRLRGVNNKSWPQIKKIIIEHAKLFLKYNNNLIPLRKHLIHYTKGQKNASTLRQKIIRVETLEDLEKL